MVTIKTNTEKFLAANRESRVKFLEDVLKKLPAVTVEFVGKIKLEQMSGQQGYRYTNVVTDQLRGDWFTKAEVTSNQSVKAFVWSTTPYAPLHENGGDFQKVSKLGKSYVVHYHKRLFIGEAFEQSFAPEMARAINDSAAEWLR